MKHLLIAILSLAVIIGCVNEQPTEPPTPPDEPEMTDPGAARMLDAVRQDLSERTGVPPAEIEAIEVQEVMWPDASLGCPQPDHMYAQVVTPGYRIVLRANNEAYRYHTDRNRHFVLCEQDE